ncbi:MAG: hypothetical protein AB1898_22280 [Acidobacteriota bacterium]
MAWRVVLLTLGGGLLAATIYVLFAWGNPVSPSAVVVESSDFDRDGRPDRWHVDTTQDGKADVVEMDTNGDGRVDRLQFGNPETKWLDLDGGKLPTQRKKLLVCLDGVPYQAMVSLWDRGYFREFCRPVPLISVFPSVSDVALTEALHADRVPGYENLYFDVDLNQMGGGATSTVSKARMPYLDILDYDEPGIFKGIAYIVPIKTFRADLGRFLKRYERDDAHEYKAHICSTDSICHILEPAEFEKYMIEVDDVLKQIFLKHSGGLDFVVFSDHGNSQVLSRRVDVGAFLAKHGYRLESSIRDARSVVIPAFGLVGAMPVYTQERNVESLSRLLTSCEGIDFCSYLDGETVVVVSRRGSALIQRSPAGKLRYESRDGDPFDLSGIQDQLRARGEMDSKGYATSQAWFLATAEHEYPDVVPALYEGVTNHVINRASFLVSFEDGSVYGSSFFDKLVTMRSTHGSLKRSSMTGFVMRNGSIQGSALRLKAVLDGLDQDSPE